MNKIFSASLIVITLALGTWGICEFRTLGQSTKELAKLRLACAERESALHNRDEEIKIARSETEKIARILSDESAKLKSLQVRADAYQKQIAGFEAVESEKQNRQNLLSQQPVIRNGDVIVFPRLLSATGVELLTNAEYRKYFGRKVYFKSGLQLSVYDVDELHLGALLQLGIDPAAAKSAQVEIDKKNKEWAEANARGAKILAGEIAERNAKQAEQDAKQAKIDEARRQQQIKENLAQQAADAERVRANADMKRAHAALINALNP